METEETSGKVKAGKVRFDWFWDITTRWYFFPILYVLLALILSVLLAPEYNNPYVTILISVLVLPSFSLYSTTFRNFGGTNVILFLYIFIILSAVTIQYYKVKKKKVIKWLVMLLLVFFLMTALGMIWVKDWIWDHTLLT